MPKRKESNGAEKEAKKPTKRSKTAEPAQVEEDGEVQQGIPTKEGSNFSVASWNVAGLRAWCKKDGVKFINEKLPDVVCLQETKCGEKNVPADLIAKLAAHGEKIWLSGLKEGYAGVSILSKMKPLKTTFGIGEPKFDVDGRVITVEFEKFFLVNVYVPNSGRGLVNLPARQEWDVSFRNYLKSLDEKKPVVIAGDFNVSHLEIDLANPKTNKKNAGFTPEERAAFSELIGLGFVDTFRAFYPKKTGAYTFWTYMGNARGKNVGWRLDYFVVSERFMDNVCDSKICPEYLGSDHCPIVLDLKL